MNQVLQYCYFLHQFPLQCSELYTMNGIFSLKSRIFAIGKGPTRWLRWKRNSVFDLWLAHIRVLTGTEQGYSTTAV